jgi:hypothetical protein
MPPINEDANGVYVAQLEANLSKSSNSCQPPRSALAPEPRRRNIGAALVALCAFLTLTLLVAGLIVLLGGRWLGVL